MHKLRILFFVVVTACVILASPRQARPQQRPSFNSVASVEDIMKSIVGPLSEKVFGSVGSVITKEGTQDIAPRNFQEWETVRSAALSVAEAGNLLMVESRAKDKESNWMTMSQQLIESAVEAADAAKARDPEKLLAAGGDVFFVCEACHYEYMSHSVWQRWQATFQSPCARLEAGAWKFGCE